MPDSLAALVQAAVSSTFTQDELSAFTRARLGAPIEKYSSEANAIDIVAHDLIEWSLRRGRLAELTHALLASDRSAAASVRALRDFVTAHPEALVAAEAPSVRPPPVRPPSTPPPRRRTLAEWLARRTPREIAAVALVVAAAGGFVGWRVYKHRVSAARGWTCTARFVSRNARDVSTCDGQRAYHSARTIDVRWHWGGRGEEPVTSLVVPPSVTHVDLLESAGSEPLRCNPVSDLGTTTVRLTAACARDGAYPIRVTRCIHGSESESASRVVEVQVDQAGRTRYAARCVAQ